MNIQNKTFIITGGASGLGFATAKMIIENGGNAVLLDINSVAGQEAVTQLGKKTKFVQTDVSNEESVKNAIAIAQSTFGGLNGAVNCAGIGPAERVVGRNGAHSLASFSRTITVNLIGSFNVIRLVSEVLQNNEPSEDGERGILISTASVAAFDGQIGQAAY
jgi:NAD(P)-dependent dehydrogenase (short-subunit alcohol dehydrogenase family)